MFRVLIADDNYEDRELLKLEIDRALSGEKTDVKFYEAASVKQAKEHLRAGHFDLLTLDIEFDRLSEGIDALPEIFEEYPTLNIIVISGKLNKAEVSEQLFRFTKDNVLKSKRWARHFDVLDKKDDKTDAIRRAYDFAFRQKEAAEGVKELFLLAESYLEKGDTEKCLEVYQKIQGIAPGEPESGENIRIMKGGGAVERARDYLRQGERVVGALLLGHYLEVRLKAFTKRMLGRHWAGLYDCLRELEKDRRFGQFKRDLFQQVLRARNKAIHHPATVNEQDFDAALKSLSLLETNF